MLLDAYQTPETAHEENWWTLVQLAYLQLWVARDEGKPIACVQIFPRRIRLLGHAIPMGGVGSVFTHPERRGEGIASELLGRAAAAMRESGMELSILFSNLHDFYGNWGWRPQKMQRSLLRKNEGGAPRPPEGKSAEIEFEDVRIQRVRLAVFAPHALFAGISLYEFALGVVAAGEFHVSNCLAIDREDAAGRAEFRRHVAERRAIGKRHFGEAVAIEFNELADDALVAQHLGAG